MTPEQSTESRDEEQEITRLVTSASEQGGGDDHAGHRTTTRFAAGMQLDVTTEPTPLAEPWPVIMHNVSDGGFAFWSKKQIFKRDSIWVREFSADNGGTWLPAHVTHCTVGIRGYLVGARFDSPVHAE